MPHNEKFSILLVDDHEIIRDGLKTYFTDLYKSSTITEAENGVTALKILEGQQFDIIITDIRMPEMNGIELTQTIKSKNPDQKVIALTITGEHKDIQHMLAAGVNGYLLKSSSKDEIFKAVESVLAGENYFSKDVTKIIISNITGSDHSKSHHNKAAKLTDREKEVLGLIVKEHSNQEIADILQISVRTVDAHKRNLLEKTNCKNLAGLAIYAMENGLI